MLALDVAVAETSLTSPPGVATAR